LECSDKEQQTTHGQELAKGSSDVIKCVKELPFRVMECWMGVRQYEDKIMDQYLVL